MAFTEKTVERLIAAAIRNPGVDVLVESGGIEPLDRYARYVADARQKAFDAMDFPINLQNLAKMMTEFDEQTTELLRGIGIAQDVEGNEISFSEIFGDERTGRPEYALYIAAKFVILFVSTYKVLNLTQNSIEKSGIEIKPEPMRFQVTPI